MLTSREVLAVRGHHKIHKIHEREYPEWVNRRFARLKPIDKLRPWAEAVGALSEVDGLIFAIRRLGGLRQLRL